MSFFDESPSVKVSKRSKAYSVDFLHKAECSACPLNNQLALRNPHMEPTGSDSPDVYILGEAPGKDEDKQGVQFVGKAGQMLRKHIPARWKKGDRIRWNNCVRTRPPQNKTPNHIEVECCRPSVVRDIEKTKPKAIFGFGNIPLNWATGLSQISIWCGRKMPIRVGTHTCWFFPMMHPSYVNRSIDSNRFKGKDYGSELEFAFSLHLKRAFAAVDSLRVPEIITAKDATSSLTLVDSTGGRSDVNRIIKILDKMSGAKLAGLDYETNGTRPYRKGAKVLTAAVCSGMNNLAFPLDHKQSKWTKKERALVIDAWKDFIFNSDCLKVAHKLSFELEWSMFMFGYEALYNANWGCSMAQAHTLDERYGAGALSLDGLCLQYFGISVKALNPIDRANLDNEELSAVLKYNVVDARFHKMLFRKQHSRLKSEGLLDTYHHAVERIAGLVPVQIKGVPVSNDRAKELGAVFAEKKDKASAVLESAPAVKKFNRRFGRRFQPGSPRDVKDLMNKVLGFRLTSADEAQLSTASSDITKALIQYRHGLKMESTYTSSALDSSPLVFDGLFHPEYGTCTTKTWRTGCEDPNIQNWPKREDVIVRSIVAAYPGWKLVAFDYAGIQARNVAMESRDKNLVKYFRERYDIHFDWMERIARRHPKWVKGGMKKLRDPDIKKKYRHASKNKLVFPFLFGSGPTSVASNLKIPFEAAKDLSAEFWDEFSGVHTWQDNTRQLYRRKGYVTGLSGFRRRAPVEGSEVINTPIQSDEAIIVCDAILRLVMLEDPMLWPILEVHDDLTFLWPAESVDRYAETVISVMLDTSFEWAKIVPMGVEMSVGDNWADLEEVGEYYSDNWNGSISR